MHIKYKFQNIKKARQTSGRFEPYTWNKTDLKERVKKTLKWIFFLVVTRP